MRVCVCGERRGAAGPVFENSRIDLEDTQDVRTPGPNCSAPRMFFAAGHPHLHVHVCLHLHIHFHIHLDLHVEDTQS